MKTNAAKLGALFYILWGLLHMAGAGWLLVQASTDGAPAVLATIGSGPAVEAVPALTGGFPAAVLAYYAWNLLWLGALVVAVGAGLNWRNRRSGFWLNLVIVSAVDIGLLGALVVPGYMALADGLLGVALWLPALLFSTLGVWGPAARSRATVAPG